jgi:hypothetical protein
MTANDIAVLVRTVTLVRWCLRGVPQQYVDYTLTAMMNGGPKLSLPMTRSSPIGRVLTMSVMLVDRWSRFLQRNISFRG